MTKPTTILILVIASFLCLLNCYALLPRHLNLPQTDLPKRTDAYGLNLSGTEIIARVDSRFSPTDPNYEKSWLDGQIVDIRPMGFHTGRREKKRFAIIKLPNINYWTLRGSKDWKSTKPSVLALKKYLSVTDKDGYYPWQVSDFTPKERIRDYFLDFRDLLNQGYINKSQYFDIYNKHKEPQEISLNNITQLTQLAKKEDTNTRLARLRKNPILTFMDNLINKFISPAEALVSQGTYTICASGCDYATIQTFEADIDSQLTGNLTAEHADEETSISAIITFDTDTNGYLLKITAESGAEHNGGAYGNGARINYGTYHAISFDQSSSGDLKGVEVSKLALDISGAINVGIDFADLGASSGQTDFLINRILVKCDSASAYGIYIQQAYNAIVTNNIVYDCSKSDNVAYGIGIKINMYNISAGYIYNNTIAECNDGICQDRSSNDFTNVTLRNNLVQGSGNSDYRDDGAGFGTTASNISEDPTSPDAAYRNQAVAFVNEANDDYHLSVNDTSARNQGTDLSATFTDDVEGQSRSCTAAGGTWDIGADENISVGVVIGP